MLRHLSYSAILDGGGVLAILLVQILTIRIFGIEIYGEYAFINSILIVIAALSNFGIPNFSSRLIAQEDKLLHDEVKKKSFLLTVFFSTIAIVIFLAYSYSLTLMSSGMYIAVALYFLSRNIITLISLQLQYERRILISKLLSPVGQPFILVLILLFIISFDLHLNSSIILWQLLAISSVLVSIVSILIYRQSLFASESTIQIKKLIKWGISNGKFYLLANSSNILQKRIAVILCGFLLADSITGKVNILLQISTLSLTLLSSINHVLIPRISSNYKSRNDLEFLRDIKVSLVFGFCSSFLFLLFSVLIGRNVIDIFFTDSDSMAYYSLLVLAFGQVINASTGPIGFVLTMTNHEKLVAKVDFQNIFILALILPLLLLEMGLLGACLATAISIVIRNTRLTVIAKKQYGFHTSLGILLRDPLTNML